MALVIETGKHFSKAYDVKSVRWLISHRKQIQYFVVMPFADVDSASDGFLVACAGKKTTFLMRWFDFSFLDRFLFSHKWFQKIPVFELRREE